jgi:hypothetical protein
MGSTPGAARSGQGNNKRSYKSAFKQLAALRLMNFYRDDYRLCSKLTFISLPKPLYSDHTNTAWMRAKEDGLKNLRRFFIIWKIQREPAFIFNSKYFNFSLMWHPEIRKELNAINQGELSGADIQNIFAATRL